MEQPGRSGSQDAELPATTPGCSGPGGGGVCPREPTTALHDSASPGVHHGIAHRHHKAEETPRSSHRRTGKQKVVPPRERRLLARPGKERPGEGTQPEHTAARADQERSRFSRRGRI